MLYPMLLKSSSAALMAVFALQLGRCSQGPYAAQTPEQVPLPPAAIPLSANPPPPRVSAPAQYEIAARHTVSYAPPPWGPEDYGYIDDGYWLSDAVFDAPPDYAFGYGGVYPWVWLTAEGFSVIVEPVFDGDRYYYYRPGADLPFFVADPIYSFGYDTNGALAVVYDREGHALPNAYAGREARFAGGLLERAQNLQIAARPKSSRLAVSAQDWAVRRGAFRTTLDRWSQGAEKTPEWGAWRSQHSTQTQAAFAGERFVREAEAARIDGRGRQPQLAAQEWTRAQTARTLARASQPNGSFRINPFAGKPSRTAQVVTPAKRSTPGLAVANGAAALHRGYFTASRSPATAVASQGKTGDRPAVKAQSRTWLQPSHPARLAQRGRAPTRLYVRSSRPYSNRTHGVRFTTPAAHRLAHPQYRARAQMSGATFHMERRYAAPRQPFRAASPFHGGGQTLHAHVFPSTGGRAHAFQAPHASAGGQQRQPSSGHPGAGHQNGDKKPHGGAG